MAPDPHPIDPAVRADILERLAGIEAGHGVRVLFACESGSRGWGFASPDSDYDVRFVYAHPLPWYLTVEPGRDVIELPNSDVLDINGWELRKALGLLAKGNATLVEWLDSPVIYRADDAFFQAMRDAALLLHRPERSFHHYLHMARKNYREHLRGPRVKLKKYLYVLRPVLAAMWVEQGRGTAPMRFEYLVDALVTDCELLSAIDRLPAVKRSVRESEYGDSIPVIDHFLVRQLGRLETTAAPITPPADRSVLDQILAETVLRLRP